MKKEPTYKDAFMHGLYSIKKYTSLWFCGFFAMFLGQFGLWDFFSSMHLAQQEGVVGVGRNLLILSQSIHDVSLLQLSVDKWVWFFWLCIFVVGFFLLIMVLAVVSQGTIVYALGQQCKLLHKKRINIEKAWQVGVRNFWTLFGITLIKKALIFFLTCGIGITLLAALRQGSTMSINVFFGVFAVAVVLGIILSFLVVYATAYVVIEKYNIRDALVSSWRLFLNHWLVSLEVGVLMLLLYIAVLFGIAVVVVLCTAEVFLLTILSALFGGIWFWVALEWLLVAISVVIAVYFLVMLYIFSTTVWVYLFMKMHKTGVKSILQRYSLFTKRKK